MPPRGSSPRTLDLFEVTLTIPTPASAHTIVSDKPSVLASLSDAQLAQRLGQVVGEVQRRLEEGRGNRPELEAVVKQANVSLCRLVPEPAKHARSSYSRKTSSALQEGHRKAIRAALLAGVAPTQVAKHFGLPLAAVRKVLNDPT